MHSFSAGPQGPEPLETGGAVPVVGGTYAPYAIAVCQAARAGTLRDDAQLMFQVGYRVSERAAFPEWKPGTEFKARRDEMMGAR